MKDNLKQEFDQNDDLNFQMLEIDHALQNIEKS
jgi:hypothetical protein